jgi:hypothetical protein
MVDYIRRQQHRSRENDMSARIIIGMAALLTTLPVTASELKPEEARRFVAGKLFAYSCVDGSAGAGRIFADGSVAGTIRLQGKGPVTYAMLPAGTLRINNDAICASLKGLPWQPCFNLIQTDEKSFVGSIRRVNHAYCSFTRRNPRTNIVRATPGPLQLDAFRETARWK